LHRLVNESFIELGDTRGKSRRQASIGEGIRATDGECTGARLALIVQGVELAEHLGEVAERRGYLRIVLAVRAFEDGKLSTQQPHGDEWSLATRGEARKEIQRRGESFIGECAGIF